MGLKNLVTLGTVALMGMGLMRASALEQRGLDLDVVVNGAVAPEYRARHTTYVEAVEGREYVLRLRNPLPVRIAVALAVDGLNTIDARHTHPRDARKWVLEPYQTIDIAGWQVSATHARRFFFTSEPDSYGATLGKTENLGVIEAVVFRERSCRKARGRCHGYVGGMDREEQRDASPGEAAPAPSSARTRSDKAVGELSDESAATGMGDPTTHRVHQVAMDLEPHPLAVLRIRYEYRPQLIALGVLPSPTAPLDRRERASGFAGPYCPEPEEVW